MENYGIYKWISKAAPFEKTVLIKMQLNNISYDYFDERMNRLISWSVLINHIVMKQINVKRNIELYLQTYKIWLQKN